MAKNTSKYHCSGRVRMLAFTSVYPGQAETMVFVKMVANALILKDLE